jgi:hypothetical protein
MKEVREGLPVQNTMLRAEWMGVKYNTFNDGFPLDSRRPASAILSTIDHQ